MSTFANNHVKLYVVYRMSIRKHCISHICYIVINIMMYFDERDKVRVNQNAIHMVLLNL